MFSPHSMDVAELVPVSQSQPVEMLPDLTQKIHQNVAAIGQATNKLVRLLQTPTDNPAPGQGAT